MKSVNKEITVGPANADVIGYTCREIQLAIDSLAYTGGGTVRLLPGQYILQDSIRLRSNIRLVGDREKTILRRGPLVWSRLKEDAATAQMKITPEDASKFKVGMGLCAYDQQSGWSPNRSSLMVRSIKDGVLHLNDYITSDRWAERGGIVMNYFPLIVAENTQHSVVEGLTADAFIEDDPVLKTLNSCVILVKLSTDGVIRNVAVKNGRGDGILITHASTGCLIEDCEVANNANLGIHVGSYSPNVIVRRCHIHHNLNDGLYVCWGVDHGVFADNDIHHNGLGLLWHGCHGFSIGHQDTDNLIINNHIYENARCGIAIRQKTEANGAHRNVFRNNLIENNGSSPDVVAAAARRNNLPEDEFRGCGVSASGITYDLVFENNTVRETRAGDQRYQLRGFYFGKDVFRVRMSGNRIEGHPNGAVIDETGHNDNELQKE